MPTLRFARVNSPLGRMWVAETDAGVAAVSRTESLESLLAPLRRRFPGRDLAPDAVDTAWIESLTAPLLDLTGLASFDAAVYRTVAAIPAGETLTYGEVAALVGSPRAARAVGNAMARCPLFPAVPCHRVVRASDGWSGWGGDPAFKKRLLLSERRGGP